METFWPIRVVYENQHLLVVEKPVGLVAHPVYKHRDGTLTDYVFAWFVERGEPRPWMLHRLDKDTSGLVLFAKSPHMLRLGTRQFEEHTIVKHYLAVAWGADLPDEGVIDAPLMRDPADRRRVIVDPAGQTAQTRFAVSERWREMCLVRLWPVTGRTHQLRAHLAHLGHPLVGDPVYALDFPPVARLLLHAASITLRIPAEGGPRLRTFLAPLPDDFATALESAHNEDIAPPQPAHR
jgi:23S rRNA pseudouridine1911/1915/1917 synthase